MYSTMYRDCGQVTCTEGNTSSHVFTAPHYSTKWHLLSPVSPMFPQGRAAAPPSRISALAHAAPPPPHAPPASITTVSRDAPNAHACSVQPLSFSAPPSPSVSANVFLFSGGPFFSPPILSCIQLFDLHLLPQNVA